MYNFVVKSCTLSNCMLIYIYIILYREVCMCACVSIQYMLQYSKASPFQKSPNQHPAWPGHPFWISPRHGWRGATCGRCQLTKQGQVGQGGTSTAVSAVSLRFWKTAGGGRNHWNPNHFCGNMRDALLSSPHSVTSQCQFTWDPRRTSD